MNKAQTQQAAGQAVMEIQHSSYSGPLPHPEILEHYGRIVPNGAERIFAVFESQASHRQKMEARSMMTGSFVQIFGVISAFLLGTLAIGGGLYLVHEGKGLEGFGAFFTGLASLVGVYVYGKKLQSLDLKSKQRVKTT